MAHLVSRRFGSARVRPRNSSGFPEIGVPCGIPILRTLVSWGLNPPGLNPKGLSPHPKSLNPKPCSTKRADGIIKKTLQHPRFFKLSEECRRGAHLCFTPSCSAAQLKA